MATNAVGWFEIYVNDMQRAKTFYEAVFQLKLEQMPAPDLEMYAFTGDMNTYGAMGALCRMPEMPAGNNSVIVYFSCDDCAVEEARAGKAGGQIHKGKMSIGEYGFMSLVADTEGNMIGLHSMK